MWVGPAGYTPVDAAALQVGDPRYDQPGGCDAAATDPMFSPIPAELGAILATIRTLESGGDYSAEASSSTASGAYQFVDSTWGGYGGYARAKDAPPAVQDAAALELANRILAANNGDVSAVPVSWYIGHVPVGDEWDTVPAAPGNTLDATRVPGALAADLLQVRDVADVLGERSAELGAAGAADLPDRRHRPRLARRTRVRADPGQGVQGRLRRSGRACGRTIRATRPVRRRPSRRPVSSSSRRPAATDRQVAALGIDARAVSVASSG